MDKQERIRQFRERIEGFDPQIADDVEPILQLLSAEMLYDEEEPKVGPFWFLRWPFGGMAWLCPNWTEDQAQQAGAMFCYLWLTGVDCGIASNLASAWVHSGITVRTI